jgi:ribonuclease R
VKDWGIYVEIEENKCEGMIPMHEMTDDFYEYDEKNYCLIGRRLHKTFTLGDEVEVEVVRANLEKKQLDFRLAGDDSLSNGRSRMKSRRTQKEKHKEKKRERKNKKVRY